MAEETGLSLAMSGTPKTGFVATRPMVKTVFVSRRGVHHEWLEVEQLKKILNFKNSNF